VGGGWGVGGGGWAVGVHPALNPRFIFRPPPPPPRPPRGRPPPPPPPVGVHPALTPLFLFPPPPPPSRRPFLVKNLENTLAKLVKSLECFEAPARAKIAAAAAAALAARLGPQPEAVLAGLANDRAVQKGMVLEWATHFFRAFLATEPPDELLALLRKAKLDGRLADLFPAAAATPSSIAAHFTAAGLQPLVDFQARNAAALHVADLKAAVDELVQADPPHDASDVLRAVTTRQAETGLADADVVRVLWSAIAGAVPTHGRAAAQVFAALARQVRAYKPVLARYTETARGEGALLVHVQVCCYENPKMLKLFAGLVRNKKEGGNERWPHPSPVAPPPPTPPLPTDPAALRRGAGARGRRAVVGAPRRAPQGEARLHG